MTKETSERHPRVMRARWTWVHRCASRRIDIKNGPDMTAGARIDHLVQQHLFTERP